MDIKMIFCLFKLLTYASAGMYRLQRTSSGLWMPSQMSKRPWRSLRLSRRPPRTTRGSRRPLRSSRRPRRMARGPKRLPQMSKRPPQVTCRCLEGREDRGGRLQGCEDTATFFPDSQCRCREPDDFEFENARNRRVPCIVPFQSVVCKSSFAMRVHHSALGIWYVLLTRI